MKCCALLSVLALAAVFALPAAADEPLAYTTRSYVQDGLYIQLDGISNAGRDLDGSDLAHDATRKTWTDLVSNRELSNMNSARVLPWDADALHFITVSSLNRIRFPSLELNWSHLTFDMYCAEDTAKSSGKLFITRTSVGTSYFGFFGSHLFRFFRPDYGGYLVRNSTTEAFVGKMAGIIDGESYRAYDSRNGWTRSTPGTLSTLGVSTGDFYVGSDSESGGQFLGKYYAFRLYSRALTDKEVRWNEQIDKVRFLNGSTATVTVDVDAVPAEYGITVMPTNGLTVASGSSVEVSVSGFTTHGDDSAMAKEFQPGKRVRYDGWRAATGGPATAPRHHVETTGTGTNGSFIATNLLANLMLDLQLQHKIVVEATEGGQIALAGGAAKASDAGWFDSGTTCQLTAVPDNGNEFICWMGDIGGLADTSVASLAVPVDRARSLRALFESGSHVPVTTAWKGTGANKTAWDDPANWDNGVPQTGDDVIITNLNSTTLLLDHTTPVFNSLFVQNGRAVPEANYPQTILCTNWSTCLRANTITLGVGAVIKPAGPCYNETSPNRVWIAAETLTVSSTASINADLCGYKSKGWDGSGNIPGQGPAWSAAAKPGANTSAVYGGENAYLIVPTAAPYGNAAEPELPGSAGGSNNNAAGGAIRLDLTGTLTVDGQITAGAMSQYNQNSGCSGGGIWITCDKLTGSGKICANAVNCATRTGAASIQGGGGRVAVHYNPTSQAAETACNVRIEALTSIYTDYGYAQNYGIENGKLKSFQYEGYDFGEDCIPLQGFGTIWFPDDTLLKAASYRQNGGWKFGGRLVTETPIADLSFAGDMAFTNCQLFIEQPGLKVAFAGDVDVYGTGYYARREMGLVFKGADVTVDGNMTVAGARLGIEGGSMTVNGAVTQRKCVYDKDGGFLGGEIFARAAPTNTPNAYGATLTVNGDWNIEEGGVVRVECDRDNGAIVRIAANRNLRLAAGASINSDSAGWKYGPGSAGNAYPGASYGGRGCGSTVLKPTYGSEPEPLDPGSGGGNSYNYMYIRGGGVVLLEVARRLDLNGTISADSNRAFVHSYLTPGSGGTVNIRAARIVGTTGKISAAGGHSSMNAAPAVAEQLAAGGGGRIAIRVKTAPSTLDDLKLWLQTLPSPGMSLAKISGGYAWPTSITQGSYYAEDGTVYWKTFAGGLSVIVR